MYFFSLQQSGKEVIWNNRNIGGLLIVTLHLYTQILWMEFSR